MTSTRGRQKPLWKKYARVTLFCPFCQQPVPREKLTCSACGTSVCSFESGPTSWLEVNAAKNAVESLTTEE